MKRKFTGGIHWAAEPPGPLRAFVVVGLLLTFDRTTWMLHATVCNVVVSFGWVGED